ncbi:hypothetical protein EDD15DRAFT_2383948 [Pisolithus albus]|nr:hypothetical protein EDD15DRAFT_2383948 [Pisolithus albus]
MVSPPLEDFLQGVDIHAAAAALHANSDIARRVSISQSLAPGRASRPRSNVASHISPSPWRPHVLASDRLILMLQSLDSNTRSNYGSGLLRFTQFCDRLSIPESARMPASAELLALFASNHAGQLSDKTLNNWLAGLHFWHIVNGAPWNGDDMLRHVRRGFAKLVPPSSKRAKRPPVTLDALCILHDHLNLSNTFDAAVWAIAAIAFWSCCRLGELLIPSVQTFDPSKHVSRSVLPISVSTLENGTQHSFFHIPWSKTTLSLGADISITARDHRTCPLTALLNHCAGNSGLPSHVPLFAFRTSSGWLPMTRAWFLQKCNLTWVSVGFPDMPGHAFRIGGATELLLQGVPPDVVATQGRWKSQAFLEYWRQINSILPLFISSSADSARFLTLDTVMDNFARRTNLRTITSRA